MFAWVLAGSLVIGAPALKDERKPATAPTGLWVIERLEIDGDDAGWVNDGVRVRAGSITYRTCVRVETEAVEFYTLNGAGRVDIGSPNPMKGIWRLDGDRLAMCTAEPGDARPDGFTAPKGSKRTLWVLIRVD